ncbi:MAG: DUF749 family protein [Methanomassiliicoccales archaeon]|nr:DUF749 family protein [Methanomassiliicoccales archaeon]
MYKAHLVSITTAGSVPENLRGFVNFQAAYEGHDVDESEKVALLVIEGTASYVVIFLEREKSVEEIENRLALQKAEMTSDTRNAISRNIGARPVRQ